MYRTLVIVRHTFLEAIVQPIYSLLLGLGAAVLVIFSRLPFFTLSEDTVMFKSVGLDVVLLLVLIVTLFATSRSIFDEIEDRTMLTLMSKPLARWEVLLGKYLGIVLATLLAVVVLGVVLTLGTWWRVPEDYLISPNTIDDRELTRLSELRQMHLAGLIPALALKWLMISVLAAVGVALSTRVSLVVNLPVVILLYIAGNLTRFLPAEAGLTVSTAGTVLVKTIIPYLQVFDLNPLTIHSPVAVGQFAADSRAVSLGTLWGFVGRAAVYAAMYVFFALVGGLWLFKHRELGGAEG